MFRRLGCLGSLVAFTALAIVFFAVLAPWAFHMGGRWTLTTAWHGVGRLRDSQGHEYGLYLTFFPDIGRRGNGPHNGPARPQPRYDLRGNATVCTAQGTAFPFEISGDIYGVWRDAEGKEIDLDLRQRIGDKIPRYFRLYGAFHGPQLTLDDHKTMFMYFRPDGLLTPTRTYTSPVPEKRASVTLDWGSEKDFESLCVGLKR